MNNQNNQRTNSEQNYPEKINENNEQNSHQEVDLPTPQKKNDDITTENNRKEEVRNKDDMNANRETRENETNQNKNDQSAGFSIDETGKLENDEKKRGDKTEKLDRDDTREQKTQDADWQRDKINEANNQQGDKRNVDDKAGIVNDETTRENAQRTQEERETREDSILNRPRTETYEKDTNEDTGKTIKDMNYNHTREEEKRKEENSRKHNEENNKNRKDRKFTTPL